MKKADDFVIRYNRRIRKERTELIESIMEENPAFDRDLLVAYGTLNGNNAILDLRNKLREAREISTQFAARYAQDCQSIMS